MNSKSPPSEGIRGGLKEMRRKIIPYNPKLKSLARALRKNMTLSEVLLWKEIKGKQLLGYDFDRQKPIDNYIVEDVQINDSRRQYQLESLGVNFIRFDDLEIKTNIDWVIEEIQNWIYQHRPTPNPSQEGN